MLPLVVMVAAAVALLIDVGFRHERTTAFYYWAADAGGTKEQRAHDHAWVASHHDLVLADGRWACAWVAREPKVLDRARPGPAGFEHLVGQYRAALAGRAPMPITMSNRVMIGVQAWAHLCPGSRDGTFVEAGDD